MVAFVGHGKHVAQVRQPSFARDPCCERVIHDERASAAIVQHVVDFVGLQPMAKRDCDEFGTEAGDDSSDRLPSIAGPDADAVAAGQTDSVHGADHSFGAPQQFGVREPSRAIDDGVAVGMARARGTEHHANISRALGKTGERAAEVGFGGQTAGVPGAPTRPVHEVSLQTSDQAVRAYGTVCAPTSVALEELALPLSPRARTPSAMAANRNIEKAT